MDLKTTNYLIIIPCYNEALFLEKTLKSIVNQTVTPSQLIIVDDNSTDETPSIIKIYADQFSWIIGVHKNSENIHLPGSKVIQAFQFGFQYITTSYDIIVKADADLIFPLNYFETILNHFKNDEKIGMAGGFAYIEKNNDWILENLTDKDHIRGAFKAYRKECFEAIGGLKPAMGWDTVDELLCRFYNWKIKTDATLHVKHLKPTGLQYNKKARFKQGEAFYSIGYGFWITAIASLKLAYKKKNFFLFFDYIIGFLKAWNTKKIKLVTNEQAKFIKKYRWEIMKKKIFY
jgi:glycosyltransferase involved in cell wall biosynthesis